MAQPVSAKILFGDKYFGLSLGIAFVFLIGSYVWGELQVNKNFKKIDRIFLLHTDRRGAEEYKKGRAITVCTGIKRSISSPGIQFLSVVLEKYNYIEWRKTFQR